MSARDALIIALPPLARIDDAHARWWRVIDDRVATRGLAPTDPLPLVDDGEMAVIALAPAAETVLRHADLPALSDRQAEAAARLIAGEHSLLPPEALHVAVGAEDADGGREVAAVAASTMQRWLLWCDALAINPAAIVPSALLLPRPDAPDVLVRGTVGDEAILRGTDTAFPADPLLIEHLAGEGQRVIDVAPGTIDEALIAITLLSPINLRSGIFAPPRASVFDRATLRRAAMLLGLIILVSFAITLARIGNLWVDTHRLDTKARAEVASVLSPAPELDAALPQLDARLAAMGDGSTRVTGPLSGLVASIEPVANASIDALSWHADGTLSATIGAPRAEDINAVLSALQQRGYVVTAQARSGSDGRVLADVTMRSQR